MAVGTWHDLSRENKEAAKILYDEAKYRSAISRAYYAVYAEAAHALSMVPVSLPKGRQGPSHQKLRAMIVANLRIGTEKKRRALSRIIAELYTMRLQAAYQPMDRIDFEEARIALGLMRKALSLI